MQKDTTIDLEFIGVVPAAGIGSRMQAGKPKQYLTIAGRTILEHSVEALLQHPSITRVVVALHPEDQAFATLAIAKDARVHAVTGGATRAESVHRALQYVQQQAGQSMRAVAAVVHDAARPCLTADDLARLLEVFSANPARGALLAAPVRDTMKRSDHELGVVATVAREQLWHAQTPQVALVDVLADALQRFAAQVTDESSALELAGLRPQIVAGQASNLKVTHTEDLLTATRFIAARWTPSTTASTTASTTPSTTASTGAPLAHNTEDVQRKQEQDSTMFRIGQGFDVHKFGGPGPVVLGGIEIEHRQGLLAHSDGDVLLHALCDALLGALAMGDIGHLFPDTDPQFKGADSKALLAEVYRRITAQGYQLVNADVTVMAEVPKLKPHNAAIRECVGSILQVATDIISVKATTTEQLGFTGRQEGIACQAVVLLQRTSPNPVKDSDAV